MTGTVALLRLIGRRDRLRATLWIAGIVGLVLATAESITGLYDTQADLDNYADLVIGNTALIVQAGPGYGLDDPTTGSVVMNEVGIWTAIAVALMNIFMLVRHTRGEEESERVDLVRAAPVGRHAPLAAAMIAVTVVNAIVAVGVASTLIAYGLPTTGSLAFAAALFGAGTFYAATAALASQVTSSARAAVALAGAFLALSFVVRAVGDVGSGRATWASPLGWAQAIRAFADERWWVLLCPFVGATVVFVLTVEMLSRRDVGAGLLPQRPGPSRAGDRLGSPLGLALRLQRGSVIGWSVGLGTVGFFYGVVADQAEKIIDDNPEMADFLTGLGQGSITDAFLSTAVLMLALAATGFTIASVLRLRSEEAASRADWILATPRTRRSWVGSHLTVAVAGSTVLMAVTGTATGFGFALVSNDAGQVGRLLAASLVMVPAMLVVGGCALLLFGAVPRSTQLAWGLLAGVVVIGLLGSLLDLPAWTLALSPFHHVPALPAASFAFVPIATLAAVATVATAAGIAAFAHRDVG